ncbi:Secretory protein OPEL [Phytophthora cinnamomi]|uniref:Secretory protein OPEL n=1 Tax=Phytophthora cinnamomi TaxID=4785 RepID=UPI003559AF6E|nr:Secretory protein OPEL [Phytophthora cinnamomi]
MVKVAMPVKLALAACLATVASATTVNFINQCTFSIDLYHSQSGSASTSVGTIATGATYTTDVSGPANMFRHTDSNSATLFEMACDTGVWYDISIISPGSGDCTCLEDCKAKSGGKTGFNVPMTVTPKTNVGQGSCAKLDCPADGCSDAYQFPKDDTKTHHCPAGTELDVTFCASGNGGSGYESQQGQPSVKVGVTTPASTTAAPSEEERGAQQQQGSQQQGSQQEQGSQQQQQGSQGTATWLVRTTA